MMINKQKNSDEKAISGVAMHMEQADTANVNYY